MRNKKILKSDRSKSSRYFNKYLGVVLIMLSLFAGFIAYFNIFVKAQCTYGGSKLSWVFALACESFGNVGVAAIWFAFSVITLIFGVKNIVSQIKSNKSSKKDALKTRASS